MFRGDFFLTIVEQMLSVSWKKQIHSIQTIYAIAACDDVDEGPETLSIIPVLAHLNFIVSPSAGLNSGSSVEPKAVVECESEIGFATVIATNTVVEPYCFIGDGGTFRPEIIVKSTSMVSMGTETQQGTVLFTSLDNKQ